MSQVLMKPTATVAATTSPTTVSIAAPTPPPAPAPRPATPQPRSAKSVWLLRTVLFLTVLSSAILVYWSYAHRLQPVTAEQRAKASQMSQVSDEIEQLRFRWGPKQIEQARAQYDAAKETLFQDEDQIATWTQTLRADGDLRALDLQVKTGVPQVFTNLAAEISIVPVTIEVRP